MASVKKVVKSKGAAKKWLWWYRLIAKILITTIQVNFVLIPSEAVMRQHKLTWSIVIKIFAINLYHHCHIFVALFNCTTFFTLAILNWAALFFYSQAVFEYISRDCNKKALKQAAETEHKLSACILIKTIVLQLIFIKYT